MSQSNAGVVNNESRAQKAWLATRGSRLPHQPGQPAFDPGQSDGKIFG